jgi:hypothetical protein
MPLTWSAAFVFSEISICAENPAGIFQGFAVPTEQLC